MSIKIGDKLYQTDITHLNLSNSDLTELPDSIQNFKNLIKIYLTGNNLITLPESICNLSTLEELHINCNKIESLPQNINKLVNLHTINASYNKLTTLPETIYSLPNLKKINLIDNKLQCVSIKIKNISEVYLNEKSYQLNNLLPECEIIIIKNLESKLDNFPPNIKEIRLCDPKKVDISKLPFGCLLYINDKLQKYPL